jgi:hypothetical protein
VSLLRLPPVLHFCGCSNFNPNSAQFTITAVTGRHPRTSEFSHTIRPQTFHQSCHPHDDPTYDRLHATVIHDRYDEQYVHPHMPSTRALHQLCRVSATFQRQVLKHSGQHSSHPSASLAPLTCVRRVSAIGRGFCGFDGGKREGFCRDRCRSAWAEIRSDGMAMEG